MAATKTPNAPIMKEELLDVLRGINEVTEGALTSALRAALTTPQKYYDQWYLVDPVPGWRFANAQVLCLALEMLLGRQDYEGLDQEKVEVRTAQIFGDPRLFIRTTSC